MAGNNPDQFFRPNVAAQPRKNCRAPLPEFSSASFMKLLFLCFSDISMDVGLPDREPLGGSESCVAYLARQLAKNGHDVCFMARTPPGTPERVQAVRHVPLEAWTDAGFFAGAEFDATIALSGPEAAEHLKRMAPKAVHISWLHLLPKEKA